MANNPSTEQADMMHAKYCERVIAEINQLIKEFKQKAYAGSNASDEEINDEAEISDDAIEDVTEVVNS